MKTDFNLSQKLQAVQYQLDAPGKNGLAFDVMSLGADRQRGVDGPGADITHRDKAS